MSGVASGCNRPILLKKSRHDFCPRKSVGNVEIWFAQRAELSWFLRSNDKIERFLSCREAAPSEADFFNRIGQKQPLGYRYKSRETHVTMATI